MGLLHSALKLVLWRRMGYYYLPATHPAIKTSGATSPQRSAAALPPFLSLSRSSYTSHTRQWARLLTPRRRLCCTDTSKNHTLLSSAAFLPPSIGYSSLGVSFSFFFFLSLSLPAILFVNGHPWPVAGSLWMDWLPGWLIDRLAEREAAVFQVWREKKKKKPEEAMLTGQVRSVGASH